MIKFENFKLTLKKIYNYNGSKYYFTTCSSTIVPIKKDCYISNFALKIPKKFNIDGHVFEIHTFDEEIQDNNLITVDNGDVDKTPTIIKYDIKMNILNLTTNEQVINTNNFTCQLSDKDYIIYFLKIDPVLLENKLCVKELSIGVKPFCLKPSDIPKIKLDFNIFNTYDNMCSDIWHILSFRFEDDFDSMLEEKIEKIQEFSEKLYNKLFCNINGVEVFVESGSTIIRFVAKYNHKFDISPNIIKNMATLICKEFDFEENASVQYYSIFSTDKNKTLDFNKIWDTIPENDPQYDDEPTVDFIYGEIEKERARNIYLNQLNNNLFTPTDKLF
jgi:sulfur relay (sulfurtransferase) DsrC/TusE family protein